MQPGAVVEDILEAHLGRKVREGVWVGKAKGRAGSKKQVQPVLSGLSHHAYEILPPPTHNACVCLSCLGYRKVVVVGSRVLWRKARQERETQRHVSHVWAFFSLKMFRRSHGQE